MPYTFRIIFSGLCAFVADRRLDDTANPPTRTRVLLRDLREGLPLGDDKVEPHFARIETRLRNIRLEASNRRIANNGTIASSDFDKEVLEIILPSMPRRETGDVTADTVRFTTTADESSIAFVPTIEKVNGQAMRVKSALLGPLAANEALLVGRLELPRGTLSTNQLQDGRWGLVPIGTNVDESTPVGRLAESVVLEIRDLTDNVELRFKPFGGGEGSSLFVGPPLDSPNDPVNIDLKNRERPELAHEADATPPARDLDFAIYFDLLEPFTDDLPRVIPHLVSPDPRGSELTVHIGGCTPVGLLDGDNGGQ
jgi:hypothetical protein